MSTGASARTTPIALGVFGAASSWVMFPLAVAIAASGGTRPAWSFIQDGGWGVWVIALAMIAGVLASVGLAVWMTRRQTAWPSVFALTPLFVGLTSARLEALGMSQVMGAVAGESVEPPLKVKIIAFGTAEVMVLSVVCGVAVCTLFASAAWVFGARALSRAERGGLGSGAIAALVSGALGLGGVGAAALLWPGLRSTGFGFGWFPAVSMLIGAVLAGVALSDKQADDQAKGRALGDLIIACVYGTFGVLMASTVVHGRGLQTALRSIGSDSIDSAQPAGNMTEGVADIHAAFTSHLLFLVPVVLVAVAAAAPSLRHLGRAVRGAWTGALAPAVVGTLVLLMTMMPRASRVNTLVEVSAKQLPDDVELLVVSSPHESARSLGLVLGRRYVQLDGSRVAHTTDLTEPVCKDAYDQWMAPMYETNAITVDASLPWSRVACVLAGQGAASRRLEGNDVTFSVRTQGPTALPALPAPWSALSQPLGSVRLSVENGVHERQRDHLHLGRDVWDARFGDERETWRGSLSHRTRAISDKHLEVLGVTADPDVPFGDVLRLAAELPRQRLMLEVATTKDAALNPKPTDAGVGSGSADQLDPPGSGRQR